MTEDNFFDEQRISSKIKASIISEYFPKYCKIIIKKNMPDRISYFDLLSGPGSYRDGNLSTPLLIAQKCYSFFFYSRSKEMIDEKLRLLIKE